MTFTDQAHFNNYDATTYGWPQGIPPLVPLEFNGVNFGQCARDAHGAFIALLTELVPHIPGGLHAGKCWAFSTTDDLPDGSWSMHHRGLAADVNWDKNPMGTYSTNPYAGQAGAIPHAIASQIAKKYGFEYGGDWSGGEGVRGFKDYMHFELHLSPAVARTVTPPAADLLEEIMALTPAEYEKLVNDIGHNVMHVQTITLAPGNTPTMAQLLKNLWQVGHADLDVDRGVTPKAGA